MYECSDTVFQLLSATLRVVGVSSYLLLWC